MITDNAYFVTEFIAWSQEIGIALRFYPHKGPMMKIITGIFIFAARRRSIYPVFMHLFHRFHRFRRSEALFQHERRRPAALPPLELIPCIR